MSRDFRIYKTLGGEGKTIFIIDNSNLGGVQNPMTSDLDLGGFRIVDDSGGDLVIEQKDAGQNISLKSNGTPLVNLTGAGLESFGRTTLYDQLEFLPSGPFRRDYS